MQCSFHQCIFQRVSEGSVSGLPQEIWLGWVCMQFACSNQLQHSFLPKSLWIPSSTSHQGSSSISTSLHVGYHWVQVLVDQSSKLLETLPASWANILNLESLVNASISLKSA